MSNSRRNNNYSNNPRSEGKVKRAKSRKRGIILANIQLILTLVFFGLLVMLNVLPFKYLLVVIAILVFFVGYAFLSQLTKNYRTLGKVVSISMSIVLVFGSYYLLQTQSMLSNISGQEHKIDNMSIVVLIDNPAETINDTIDYSYGINEILDREKSNEVIANINKELNVEINTVTYSGYDALVEALYSGQEDVIIINDAHKDFIYETYPNFDDETRVLGNYEVKTAIPTPGGKDVDLTKDGFHVFISGIDVAGNISTTSRSDVNIIATINPVTKQVLLTTTPRDYYIPFPNTGGQKDKLTHAGNYGVDISIGALEDLYDIDMDYYVKVNFTTLINLVDALGGIEAYSEYSFNAGGYSFQKGMNSMDGEKALAFSRERYSFKGGDIQRGKNQMEVIKGIINKGLSPAVIVNYSSVMDSIAGSFETNMSNSEISNFIKMQIAEMTPWDIISNNVIGTNSSEVTYSQGYKSSVVIPDMESVAIAQDKINKVMGGEKLTQD